MNIPKLLFVAFLVVVTYLISIKALPAFSSLPYDRLGMFIIILGLFTLPMTVIVAIISSIIIHTVFNRELMAIGLCNHSDEEKDVDINSTTSLISCGKIRLCVVKRSSVLIPIAMILIYASIRSPEFPLAAAVFLIFFILIVFMQIRPTCNKINNLIALKDTDMKKYRSVLESTIAFNFVFLLISWAIMFGTLCLVVS